jgi:hypothetical protein
VFEALVHHLRALRERGLIEMPERSVTYAPAEEAGAYLLAGPCDVTEADAPTSPVTDAERRCGDDRRQGDRRR